MNILENMLPMIIKALGVKPEFVEAKTEEALAVVREFRDGTELINRQLAQVLENQHLIMVSLGIHRAAETLELKAESSDAGRDERAEDGGDFQPGAAADQRTGSADQRAG